MKSKQNTKEADKISSSRGIKWLGLLSATAATCVIIAASWFLYQHTVQLLTENLHQRLEAIVKTAAVQFDPVDLNVLNVESDYRRFEWRKVVGQLIAIRENNADIVFTYILRKKLDDPSQMVFVADSHSLDPYAKIDLDGNGIIDDADSLNWPGQLYEDVPVEAFEGYVKPTTNKELYEDQWGVLISGYAPIKNDSGETVAIMVVDMRADQFFSITSRTLFPFLFFISALILILFILVNILIRIWSRRVELLAELDRQKDELLGIVSHQLATPVSSARWYLEMLIDGDLGKLNKEQHEHVSSLQNICNTLSDLVSMILDVSRIQLGKMRVEKQELDLNDFFKEILNVINPKAEEKKVSLKAKISSPLPAAMLDKRLTRMTIENLLSNAVKYTPEGGSVEFNVQIKNNKISCLIKDTGCGIPLAEQDKVFTKLFRASNVRNSKIDGNGFGLYVAKGAVESQGGKIWFQSAEGKGTTFFVELPIR